MSIGRRFLDIARAELNSLLDYAAKRGDGSGDDPSDDGDGARGLHGFSARELEEELERRRSARQEVEDAIHGRRGPEPKPAPPTGSGRAGEPGSERDKRRSGSARSGGTGTVSESLRVQKAYAALEVAPASDFETVRQAYRTLMRKYHPDHHTESAETQRAANEVAQRLTEAYKLLETKLRR